MAGTLKHAFTSPVDDEGNPDEVGPDEWNAAHVQDAAGLLGKTSGAGASEVLSASEAKAFLAITGADVTGADLTKVDDTNVTLTLGGTPAGALLKATSITVGWTGTLAAGRLNANVVQAVSNDTNVTGSIATQTLALGWTGTLANSRLAPMAAYTLKGRNAGTAGDPGDVDISALTEKTTLAADDLFLIQDSAASNAFKKAKKSSIATNEIDVFLIGGQSNAVGQGTSGPAVPTGKILQYYSAAISDANDPVGNANTGSAWPAFGLAYYYGTGRILCFVPSAVSGSAQVAANDGGAGNWDTTGTLFDTSVTNVNNALTALTAAGYTPIFKGVLWSQGETDAADPTNYQTALTTMIAAYRTEFGATTPFYIFRTGRNTSTDTGFSDIRTAQEAVAAADQHTHIVFYNAYDFIDRSLMADAIHYDQDGLNEMGRIGAGNVITRFGLGGDLRISEKDIIAFGNYTILARSAPNFHVISDAAGNNTILMGATGDPTNYYRQTTHRFQNIGGSTNFAAIDTNGLGLRSTGAAFDLIIGRPSTVFTANRTLTFAIGDADRSLTLNGNVIFNAAFSAPTIAQGDLLYGSAAGTLSALAKDTGSSRFLKNSGTNNNPAWVQPAASDLSNGTTGSGAVALATAPTFTTSASLGEVATFASTNADANAGPLVVIDRNSASPANDDGLGVILFRGRNSGASLINYTTIRTHAHDVGAGTESAHLHFETYSAGSTTNRLNIGAGVWTEGATGTDKGANTFNAGTIYENNVRVLTAARSQTLFHSTSSVAAGGTNYFTYFTGGVVGLVSTVVPVGSTIRNLYVKSGAAPSAGQSFAYTLMKNGVATALTCTISDTATSASDTTNTVSFAAGDTIAVRIVTSASAAATWHGAGVEVVTA